LLVEEIPNKKILNNCWSREISRKVSSSLLSLN